MTEPSQKLLRDVAAVAVRYKPAEWRALADSLDDPGLRAGVQRLLREFAVISDEARRSRRTKASKARKPRQSKVRTELGRIRSEDPERADMLEQIWVQLRERALLPTLGAVRAFGEMLGTKQIVGTRRDQAVDELMTVLLETEKGALEQKMRDAVVHNRSLEAEYSDWVRLILGRPIGRSLPTD